MRTCGGLFQTGEQPFVREAHQLNIGSGEEWTELPPMRTARAGHTCSTARSSAGGEREAIVVVGGWNAEGGDLDSVEVYNMQRKTWRKGENPMKQYFNPDFQTQTQFTRTPLLITRQ